MTSCELSRGGTGLGDLPLEPLGPLGRGRHLVVGHAQLGLERERGLAQPLQLAPSGAAPRPATARRLAARRRGRGLGGARGGRPRVAGARLRGLDLGQIAEARREAPRAGRGARSAAP